MLVLVVERGRVGTAATLLILIAAVMTGSIAGGERLEAIDRGALGLPVGETVMVEGIVSGVASSSRGVTRIPVETAQGRIMVEATRAPDQLTTGIGIRVRGVARPPPDWYRAELERKGMSGVIEASGVWLTGERRGGLAGLIDSLRNRAESALGRQMPEREASLARGFVLGQDDAIDEQTTRDFRASGLAHLLAVSGQNVVLLGLLAFSVLALIGIGARGRIIAVAAIILIYVPLAGGGASIQRAGVMGLAGLAAVAAARPGSRLYAISLAAVVTLMISPRATSDIGWQLSFAAVIGIFVLAAPLQERLKVLVGSGGWRSGFVAGLAVTVAATIATAPLMAFHFERVSLTSLAANLAVLPAVPFSMWLGMLSAALGQISGASAIPFNLLNSVLLAYIAQIAAWLGRPSWAELEVGAISLRDLLIAYGLMAACLVAILRRVTPEYLGRDRPPDVIRRSRRAAVVLALASVLLCFALLPGLLGQGRRQLAAPPPGGARVEVLDIGQGDATLIRPDGEAPVLIDGGPPGGDIEGALESAGVERLAAVILTHPDLDHYGGLYEVFETVDVDRFLFDGVPEDLFRLAADSGTQTGRLAAGDRLDLGPARMEVLWPPPRTPDMVPPEDPNTRSLVVWLAIGGFLMLLTGDAEAEAVPVRPGPVDVLRVAHHGSDDTGLPDLLDSTEPDLAIISSGEDNTYGHPTETTLAAIAAAGVPLERTDQDGTISVVVDQSGWRLETGD